MALLVEEGRGVDRERDAELALAAGVVQLDHVVGVLPEVIAGRIDERLEVEPLAVERLGAADAGRADDVRPIARRDLGRQRVAGALVRDGFEREMDVRVGGIEFLDHLLLDLDLLGASPPPRQQYQRSSTTSPLPAACDAGGAADEPGAWLAPGALVVVD